MLVEGMRVRLSGSAQKKSTIVGWLIFVERLYLGGFGGVPALPSLVPEFL